MIHRLLVFLALALPCFAQTVVLMPPPRFYATSSTGAPLVNGCVFTYAAGTTTPLATYTDSSGSVPNANPVILDANGTASIWFSSGVAYSVQLWSAGSPANSTCSNGSLVWSQNNVTGIATQLTNTSTLLCYSKSGSALVGNATDQNLFSACSITAGLLASGNGIRITIGSTHSTGSATVTYKLFIDGTVLGSSYCQNSLTAYQAANLIFMNDPGSTTSNALTGQCSVGSSSTTNAFVTSTINVSSGAVTVQPTFNVANTDQVTPDFFMVELIH